ncbi:MAG: InlB B-repeat-containing protein [Methanomassiliicoccaceae archaeon]|nr:InlB B-repeat-containing protein [Methanomassiliicoccaceae archaeon]
MNAYYYLTQNLTLTGTWTPIGIPSNPFTGVLDGQGFMISAITTTSGISGLFGVINGATISDLTVNVSLAGTNSSAGGIASQAIDSNLRNVNVTGTIITTGSGWPQAGGLIGEASGSIVIENGSFSGSIQSVRNAGGIIGMTQANTHITITYTSNGGSVTSATNFSAGGIIGSTSLGTHGIINSTYNHGNITGATNSPTGGIIGYINAGQIHISNSVNTGAIAAGIGTTQGIGGIVGVATSQHANVIIQSCYNAGSIIGGTIASGGIVGVSTSIQIVNCFNIGSVSVTSNSTNAAGIAAVAEDTRIINTYNAGSVTGGGGGITGSATNTAIINSYFAADILFNTNATNAPDRITRVGNPVIDGVSTNPERSDTQYSGAKPMSDMMPSLSDAISGNSVFYTGNTTSALAFSTGWDFTGIWTIDSAVNSGLPTLQMQDMESSFQIRYIVSFSPEGGSPVDPISVPRGGLLALPSDPVYEGYNFAGWFTVSAQHSVVTISNFNTAAPIVSNMTLTAIWTIDHEIIDRQKHLVIFAIDAYNIIPITVYDGDHLTKFTPEREGYHFIGWFTDPERTEHFDFYEPITSDIIIYAGWEAIASNIEDDEESALFIFVMIALMALLLSLALIGAAFISGRSMPAGVLFAAASIVAAIVISQIIGINGWF